MTSATTSPSDATPLHVALLGNPNCGKTALFNLMTGARQKVANYAGVTVERKEGWFTTPEGKRVRMLDLPGAYSLQAQSLDEAVTRDVLLGKRAGEPLPELIACVTDATHLRLNLRLVLEARNLGLPMVLVLNMADIAKKQGIEIDEAVLARELGIPVVSTVAVKNDGADSLLKWIDTDQFKHALPSKQDVPQGDAQQRVLALHDEVRRILDLAVKAPAMQLARDDKIDAIVLHPVWGLVLLAVLLFLIFQAVFAWAQVPMDFIDATTTSAAEWLNTQMADGPLRSLLADGVIAGAGGVIVFLPQILILFFFILVLEDSGYLPRAAFLLDRLMSTVGLSGRSFIPLLSSFACAIPGVMAARSIPSWRDRLVTIMIAPLMTCSARLPVYALLISAFIPSRTVAGIFNLQGLVLFGLYIAGIVSAMAVAYVAKLFGARQGRAALMMELPAYRMPSIRSLLLGLYERAIIFLKRVGGIILALTIVLWFLSSFPGAPEGATDAAITYSLAGRIGEFLALLFAPIGFNWQICIALIPGMAAREVAVSALGTVYALSATGDDTAAQLGPLIAHQWSLATALSLLTWFIFAPQCLATLATVRRETNSWKYAAIMAAYLFGLAYIACFIMYQAAVALGWG
ncbi:ferrous iron transporter B [Alcaligenes faecalis]|uniref:ferrous iron transporter B n=1 Tax=Alcaligenes faecalis TaxID=511 RepID=UPI001293B23C|nr:ferrous iron transporter B [Alcaligenes faecalis]MBX6964300.1 ferrous iron transporter B [Providencia rettgeri]MBX7032386.1 ferrous iron transporter B [Alcaligenes faecalis]QFY76720.1 ferrous iron transporter B [Alcaligenes faecalis]